MSSSVSPRGSSSDSGPSIIYFLCSSQGIPISAVSSRSLYCLSERPKEFWILLARFVATIEGLSTNSKASFSFELRGETYYVQPLKNHLPFFVVLFATRLPCNLDLLMVGAQFSHILSTYYESALRNLSIEMSTKSRHQLNHGTFSNTMEANDNDIDDYQFMFTLIEEYYFYPILQGTAPKFSWQSHLNLLLKSIPPIYLLLHDAVKPLFIEISTAKLNRNSNAIEYKPPSALPSPLLSRAWVELALTCLSIEKTHPKSQGSQLGPGLWHFTRAIGLVEDGSEKSAMSPVSLSKELNQYMLLLSTVSTVSQFSFGMLIPKSQVSPAKLRQNYNGTGSRIQLVSLHDISQQLQDMWMAAVRRVGGMFPAGDHSGQLSDQTFQSALQLCSEPTVYTSNQSSSSTSTSDGASTRSAAKVDKVSPKKNGQITAATPVPPADKSPHSGTSGAKSTRPGRQFVATSK